MPRFLAIYIGTATARDKRDWNRMDPEVRRELEQRGMAAWGEWMQRHGAAIVDAGAPLGATMRASPNGIAHAHNHMTGYVLVEAPSHAEAAEMFRDHPHFAVFPGDSVEIMACLPVPDAGSR